MATLYFSPGACSLAAHVALEEAGAAFDAVRTLVAEGAHRTPEYLKINPHGRVPALAEADGWVLTETPAIMTYAARARPEAGLIPEDPRDAARVQELLTFFASSVHVTFAQVWRSERFAEDETARAAVQATGRAKLPDWFDELDALARGGWVVGGRFSLADAYPFVFARWARRIGFDMSPWPNWRAHTRAVLARPAVGRVLAREGLAAAEFVGEAVEA
jgi:glutathione S-transferase